MPTPRCCKSTTPRESSSLFDGDEHVAHVYLLRGVMASHELDDGTEKCAVWPAKVLDGAGASEGVDLSLEERTVHAPISMLFARYGTVPKSVQGPSGWVYHARSFGCWRPHQWPRRAAIVLVEAPCFEPLILVTIMANCATMAWSSPLDPPGTPKQELLSALEWVYLGVFTFELFAKILAYGLCGHHHSYLRDAWCQLDLVIVGLAWIPILLPSYGDGGGLTALRSVRALRPLRALKRVPGMPTLVQSILKSIPALGNVAGLTAFILSMFGIVGMELFHGVLHERCAEPRLSPPAAPPAQPSHSWPWQRGQPDAPPSPRVLSPPEVMTAAWVDTGVFCHSDPTRCGALGAGSVCVDFLANPSNDLASFDSVAAAMIPILQAVCFDAWTEPMYEIMQAYSPSAALYFVAIGVLGGFFVINLFLAVIADEFIRTSQVAKAEKSIEDMAAANVPASLKANVLAASDLTGAAASAAAADQMQAGTQQASGTPSPLSPPPSPPTHSAIKALEMADDDEAAALAAAAALRWGRPEAIRPLARRPNPQAPNKTWPQADASADVRGEKLKGTPNGEATVEVKGEVPAAIVERAHEVSARRHDPGMQMPAEAADCPMTTALRASHCFASSVRPHGSGRCLGDGARSSTPRAALPTFGKRAAMARTSCSGSDRSPMASSRRQKTS